MPYLLANGLPLSSIFTRDDIDGDRRDIGHDGAAMDGTLRRTRQTRKNDIKFRSVPLTPADAFAWECLLTGEGEVWPFDATGFYGCKGLGPSVIEDASIVSGSAKFGTSKLRIAGGGYVEFANALLNSFGSTPGWTVGYWRFESGVWRHTMESNIGNIWRDGVLDGFDPSDWHEVNPPHVALLNNSGSNADFDDFFCLPFAIPEAWALSLGTRTEAYPPTPYLDLSGELVPEQATRRVLGTVRARHMRVRAGVRHRLDVELKAR